MKSGNASLGEKLVQTIADRLAAQSERRRWLHGEAARALERLLKRRAENQGKLVKKLEGISLASPPGPRFSLFWRSHQKRINQQLARTNQQLVATFRLQLKAHESETRDLARLMQLIIEHSGEGATDRDPA